MTKTIYTKMIKGGKLKLTDLEDGATVSGILLGTKQGKFGSNLLIEVQGKEVEIFPAGNVKRKTVKEVDAGTLPVGVNIRITRLPDYEVEGSGFTSSNFDVSTETAGKDQQTTAVSTQDKLAAIRNKRTVN